jgi:uncharacterized protein YdeI (YjbR/CyaY-like superfamily)
MGKSDKRVELYISRSAEFAQPVLWHILELVHKACPEVEEAMKWSFPHFVYKGSNLCSMAAFKQHCAFTFWLGSQMKDPENILKKVGEKTAMGHLGQIKSLKDLPSDKILITYLKEAMRMIDAGVKPEKASAAKKPVKVPAYFSNALSKNKKALATFENFSPSHKREYVEWVTEAKTEETRNKRLKTTLEWLKEGKNRNWKYAKK